MPIISKKIIVQFSVQPNQEKIIEISKIIPPESETGVKILRVKTCCSDNLEIPITITKNHHE